MDGLRVPIQASSDEYAVAFDALNRVLIHPKAQRYVEDPSFWLKDTKPNVSKVRIYDIDRINGALVILWREVPDREFDKRG